MVKIYTTPSCASCRKAKKWFEEHNISYKEKNIFTQPLTIEDIKSMLNNAENGFDDIISMRSKVIKDNNLDIQEMKVSELEKLILENPSILKRPIIIENRKFQVGYNDEEIRVFIPRELRKISLCNDCDKDCAYQRALNDMKIK